MSVVLYTVDGLPYGPPMPDESGPDYEARLGLQGCKIYLAICHCSPRMTTVHAVRPDGLAWCLKCGYRNR